MKNKILIVLLIVLNLNIMANTGFENLTNYQNFKDEKITLDLKQTDIDDVLKIFSDKMQVNIVKNANVKAKITINIKDMLITEAFNLICKTHNLRYIIFNNFIQVFNQKDFLQEGGILGDNVFIYKVKNLKAETLYKKLTTIGFNSGKKTVFGNPEVYFDERLNLLIFAGDFNFYKIKNLKTILNELDKPTPQVLLEAKILSVKLSKSSSFGIRWNSILSGNIINIPNGLSFGSGDKNSSLNSFVIEGGDTLAHGISISALLNALSTEGDVQTLSSPRLLVMNNEEAKIIEGNNEPYKEVVKDNYGGSIENWKFIEVGIGMTVKPSIFRDSIELTINPEISSASREVGTEAAPTVTKSQINTVVSVKSGSTLVLGGLIKTKKENIVSGIPFLYKIPILGYLFSKHEIVNNKYEIVFLITPTIIK